MTTALPIQSRPFNLEHAKAGAPYACKGGEPATILKWDGRRAPLVGVWTASDQPNWWGSDGKHHQAFRPADLVMTPLGYIDGKPVFVGDRLVRTTTPDEVPKAAGPEDRGPFTGWTWPAPAKVYPQSTMKMSDVSAACKGHHVAVRNSADFESGKTTMEIEAWGNEGMNNALRWIANAALRHAIDAGQVVVPGNVTPDDDAVITIGGKNFVSVNRLDKGRAVRDMAVAKAVLIAANYPFGEMTKVSDLPAIIAKVPA